MNKILYYFLFFCTTCISQQTIYVLHPVVGDTIDVVELSKYQLFTEIKNVKKIVLNNTNEVFLLSYTEDGFNFKSKEVSKVDIELNRNNILKLEEYYQKQQNKDSIIETNQGFMKIENNLYKGEDRIDLSDETKNNLRQESNRYNSLKNRAQDKGLLGSERNDFIQTGASGVELFHIKKKKKNK